MTFSEPQLRNIWFARLIENIRVVNNSFTRIDHFKTYRWKRYLIHYKRHVGDTKTNCSLNSVSKQARLKLLKLQSLIFCQKWETMKPLVRFAINRTLLNRICILDYIYIDYNKSSIQKMYGSLDRSKFTSNSRLTNRLCNESPPGLQLIFSIDLYART